MKDTSGLEMTGVKPPFPWRVVIRGSLVLAAVVVVCNLILGLTGVFTRPITTFTIVIVVELVGLILVLRASAGRGLGYRRQVAAGAIAVLSLATILVPAAYVQLKYIMPDYAEAITESARARLLAEGHDADRVAEVIEEAKIMYTPVRQAWFSFPGTLMTCIPMVVLIAIFVRDRSGVARRSGEGP